MSISEITKCIRTYAFRSTKINELVDTDQVVVKMRENEEYDDIFYDDEEVDWNHVCFYPNKCGFIEATEEPLNVNMDLKSNCVNNGNLI